MKVAIIDDQQNDRDLLKAYLRRYEEENHLRIEVDTFCRGDDFVEEYQSIYDVIIFDIDMPGTNGMECARKIREKDETVLLLFVTNMAQYAINGYEVDAVDYMIKPIGYFEFSMKFQKAIRKLGQQQDKWITVDASGMLRKIRLSDIYYVEVYLHNIIYHLKDGELKVRGSMKEQEELLSIYHFSRIHKSYLVNLAYVENIKGNTLSIAEDMLPIGKVYKNRIMQEFLHFIRV